SQAMANCQHGVIARSGARGRQGPLTPTLSQRVGRPLSWAPSADAVAGGGGEAEMRRLRVGRCHRQGANLPELLLQFVPGLSAVCTHVDVAIEARRSDDVGPLRVRREPVDDRVRLHWQLGGLPRLTTILGALDRAGDSWDRVA